MFRGEAFFSFAADYLSPVCLLAIALFTPPMSWTLPKALTRSAFGIYLCHPIFIDLVEVSGVTDGMLPVQELATKATMAIIGTFGLCLWLQNRPSLSWVIGIGKFPGFQSATERRATV
jgi:surface polysaccharide O-acyltransferase-like enzyme